MRSRALLVVFAVLLSAAAEAQVMWQPTAPPLVTADNEAWYRTGAAVEWNGEFYLPAGPAEAFNAYQMVRAGSYRGIPLYTDATLEPYSIVFVPISGGRVQPYERPRTGMLAGSVGSRAPLIPTGVETASGLGLTPEGYIAQAAAPPTFARAYDLAPSAAPPAPAAAVVATAGSVPAARPSVTPRPTATSGRTTTVSNRGGAAARPKGINSVWLEYGGRRWQSAGKALDLDSSFTQVGSYRGSPIYQRGGDATTIYVPTVVGLVAPFKIRS